MSLQGIIRGKQTRATFSDKTAPKLLDRVNRQFKASAPKQAMGFGFYLCRHLAELRLHGLRDRRLRPSYCWMAGRAERHRQALSPDAQEQALHDRRPIMAFESRCSIHVHSLFRAVAEADIEPSVASGGDSYDSASTETINNLYKAEVIHRRDPSRNFEAVEFTTLEWINCINHRRLLEPIGNLPPAEAEDQ